MMAPQADPMMAVAEAVSDLIGDIGFAFVEDDHLQALADTLRAFLQTAGIPTDDARTAVLYREVATYQATPPAGTTTVA